ncbi:MAG: RNA polymerase subunit sigma-24 [Bradyrhizobiaceae bacterium PARB1]|jgi:RNA polymerase sigma factor (sigma-70 family)|nr:MAG: RNA polymerase subunit sigma-24 [Bradyrhizobiaceae bacterium PARB1]
MTQSWASLRTLLVDEYEQLRRRLARRLGSTDLANEALQETWLRLERSGEPGALKRPDAYLLRIALNVAADRRDTERRRLALSEVEMLRHLDDDELDPERFAESRSDIAALTEALNELQPRCRAIFVAARLDEIPHKIIAAKYGISTRMVERELKRALEHCSQRLERISHSQFGSAPSKPST